VVAFLPQTRLRSGLEPSIEVLIQSDVGAVHLAPKVAIAQHLIKVVLGMADGAADNPAVVAPFAGSAIAPKEDAHQPPVPSATHDLPGFSGQTRPPSPKNLAHHWHTGGENRRFNSRTYGEGGVRGNHFDFDLLLVPD
jgi:hypothetical protein